jgi:hypothetical protein
MLVIGNNHVPPSCRPREPAAGAATFETNIVVIPSIAALFESHHKRQVNVVLASLSTSVCSPWSRLANSGFYSCVLRVIPIRLFLGKP